MANRRKDDVRAEKITLTKEHPEVTATTVMKVYKVPVGRAFHLTRALYHNITGLAADATNAFAGTVQNAATVAFTLFNTDSGDAGGALLTADAFVEGVAGTAAARSFVAGDEITLVLTEDAAATLPAGTLILEGLLY